MSGWDRDRDRARSLRSTYARPTARRQREQGALDLLDKARTDLWSDLSAALDVDPMARHTVDLVIRVREMGRFLGRPTRWTDVEIPKLSWYGYIERVPEYDLWPETVPVVFLDEHDDEIEDVELAIIDHYDRETHLTLEIEDDET